MSKIIEYVKPFESIDEQIKFNKRRLRKITKTREEVKEY